MQTLSVSKINKYLSCIKKGSESGLTKLFEYTYSNLYVVALAYLHDKNDVDDVLSKAYENVVKYIATFDLSMNGYNWLFTIVKNCALEFNKRANKTAAMRLGLDENVQDNFDVLEYVLIKEAIAALDVDDKQLLYQIYWEGLTVKEVAKMSDIPKTTLYSRLTSIYKKLKAFYDKYP